MPECTPQALINASACFQSCLTEFHADTAMVVLTCIATGGIPPIGDVVVIGGEGDPGGGDVVVIGGEGGGQLGGE